MSRTYTMKLLANIVFGTTVFLAHFVECHGGDAESLTIQIPREESSKSSEQKQSSRKDQGQFSKVLSVESMIHSDADVQKYLNRTPAESSYMRNASLVVDRNRTTELSDGAQGIWSSSYAGWTAAQLYTRPLYFEQVALERYGCPTHPCLQPFASYTKFLGTIPLLPIKVIHDRPHERIYPVGHYAQ